MMPTGPAPQILSERLRDRLVLTNSGCIEWTGATTLGYGRIAAGSRADGSARILRTHRLAWELANGPIPTGMMVCHRCDNPPCCNVDHLFLGSHLENMADMVAKGRAGNADQSLTQYPKPLPVTRCSQDHPYSTANTYMTPSGSRQCRACNKAAVSRYAARKRLTIQRMGAS